MPSSSYETGGISIKCSTRLPTDISLNFVAPSDPNGYVGINKSFGARPLRRTIQSLVEDSLAEAILENAKGDGAIWHMVLTVENEKVVVKG